METNKSIPLLVLIGTVAMKYILLFTILLYGLGCCPSLHAQHIVSRELPFFYQLPSNEIFDIYQDREGFLWFGTTNGLARYDGFRLQSFRSDYKNLNLLTGNSVSALTDNARYVWIGTRNGLNLYDKQTCRISSFPDERFLNKNINYLATDQSGNVWVAVENKVYQCNPEATAIREYIPAPTGDRTYNVSSVYIDRQGTVWALTNGAGLFRYDVATDSFKGYPRLGGGNAPYTMYQDKSGNYWIGTWGEGLWQFFPDEPENCYKRHHVIHARTGESEPIFYSMTQDDTFGYLWLLSYNELYALKYTEAHTLENVDIHDRVNTHMMYTKITKDREGNLWLGSYDMAYTVFFDDSRIDSYPLPQLKEHMGWDANLLNLCMDTDSVMWLSQDRYGLCLYDLQHDLFADTGGDALDRLGEVDVIVKSRTKPGVWVTPRFFPKVLRVTHRGMTARVEEDVDLSRLVENPGVVRYLAEDNQGNLWILTRSDLLVKSPDGKIVIADASLPDLQAVSGDNEGRVWGVSSDKCLYRLEYTGGQIVFDERGQIESLAPQETVAHICMDQENCLWLATSLGRIFRSEKDGKGVFSNMDLDSKLDNCSMLGLLAERNNVWIISNKKVLQYDIRRKTCVSYATSDENICVDIFRYKAFGTDGRGGLYVGGHRGFVHISSDGMISGRQNKSLPVVSDVRVGNQSVFFTDNLGRNTVTRVTLKPDDRNIEIFFSPLQYALSSKVRMAYKLEGMDKDWTILDEGRSSAFYNTLRKGKYAFRLKVENEQGKWIEDKVLLTLVKEPAFYETWWAYTIYIVLLAMGIYGLLHLYIRRMRRKNEMQLEEEMIRTKLNYFTNVSHELLTPLTVISCMADYMEQKLPAARSYCDVMKSNVDRLKRLIQQVLDFRKMDVGKMKLNVSEGDVREFVQGLCENNFRPIASKKGLSLEMICEPAEIVGYLDFDKLDKILYNLLSNAIKYTPENKGIKVVLHPFDKEGKRWLSIQVADEGIGIAPQEIERIFTRFYSDKRNRGIESNGIGLSLTKELVSLHHGTISVASTLGAGTCFTVEIPIDKDAYAEAEMMEESFVMQDDACGTTLPGGDVHEAEEADGQASVLLIDDNTELLYIMRELFKDKYNVLVAADGKQAWEQLNASEVDVIVCDVMLPDVNGWQLCSRIKSDVRFNHIPVIILTAKNGADDQVASYNAGADGYIAKPFDMKVLQARVDNLIKASRQRQAAFRKEEDVNLEPLSYPSADKEFLEAVIASIEAHLEQAEFDQELLSKEMGMSKSTLYRKIKSVTGLTPLDFVRNVKMKRACMMLADRSRSISEVAYAVGFNNPKYFTKCFKEEFGLTPTEYQQKQVRG